MDDHDPTPRSGLRRVMLGGGWSVGVVLGLMAASTMPAWPLIDATPQYTPAGSRILAMALSVGMLVGVVLLAAPRVVAWLAATGVLASPPAAPEADTGAAVLEADPPRH